MTGSNQDAKIRLHLWRVHASSFAALVFTQVLIASYLYFWKPELNSMKYTSHVKRAEIEGETLTFEKPTPHTIWTRLDLLTGDKSLRRRVEPKLLHETRAIQSEMRRSLQSRSLDTLKRKALDSFERLKS